MCTLVLTHVEGEGVPRVLGSQTRPAGCVARGSQNRPSLVKSRLRNGHFSTCHDQIYTRIRVSYLVAIHYISIQRTADFLGSSTVNVSFTPRWAIKKRPETDEKDEQRRKNQANP